MSELLKSHENSATLKQKAVRRMVGEAIERECDDEEFEELMNVLGLDKNAKKFKVSLIRECITEAQAREEEDTEDSEPNYDIGGEGEEEDGEIGDDAEDDFLDHVQNQPGSDEQYTILDEGDDGDDSGGDGFLEVVNQNSTNHHLSEDLERQRKLNELEESLDYVGEEEEEGTEEDNLSSMATYRSKNLSDSKNEQDDTGLTNGGATGDEYTIDLGPLSEEDVITSPEVHGYADQVNTLEQSLEETSTELEQLKLAHRRLLEAYR